MNKLMSLLVAAAFATTAFAQSVEGIGKVRQAQNLAVDRLVERLSDTNASPSQVARDTKALAESIVALQVVEASAYKLADQRDAAPQTMTRTAIVRSLDEADRMGVSRSTRRNLETEWKHARTLQEADAVVAKVQAASATEATEVADRGTFRRFLPAWVGGTTSYANYRVPAQAGETEEQLAARLKALEGRIMALAVPTVTK